MQASYEGLISDREEIRLREQLNIRQVTRRTEGKRSVWSRHVPRQRPRSPNRQASRERRRLLGGSGALPNTIRHHYTEGQRSVLCVVGGEIKRTGQCSLPIDAIAAKAGVCRTTVQTTLHEARRLGHVSIQERPQSGRKSLTNIVRITDASWHAWLKRGGAANVHQIVGSNSLLKTKLMNSTKNIGLKEEGTRDENKRGDSGGPS